MTTEQNQPALQDCQQRLAAMRVKFECLAREFAEFAEDVTEQRKQLEARHVNG